MKRLSGGPNGEWPPAPGYIPGGYKYGRRCGGGWIGGPTLMFGEGYSPDGFEGPAVSLGDVGLGLKAVLPGDSEQLLSEPESS